MKRTIVVDQSRSVGWKLLGIITLGVAFLGALGCGESQPKPLTPKEKADQHVAATDQKAAKALENRVKGVRDVFRRGAGGAGRFAEEALSWKGKWVLVKEKVGAGNDGEHARFLADLFAEHVLKSDDLKAALEAAVQGYLKDLDAIENELLVQLRADLDDGEMGRTGKPAFLATQEAFAKEYRRLAEEVRKALEVNLKMAVGKEVVSFVAMDVATQIVLRIGQVAAAELGVETAILGSGAASGLVTIGIGLVVGLIVDQVVAWLLKQAGYDPEAAIADKVRAGLGQLESHLVDGGSGKSGLVRELAKLRDARSKVRHAVLEKLVQEGGKP
jgi:hypothetical protein